MNRTYVKYIMQKVTAYLDAKTSDIDHKSVIGELAARADLSGSYLLSIVLANLIALLGLLVNSVAVVIGAMLISPLMGPIFTAALSFTMGDVRLGRKALRNIVASIGLTVVMAAFFTILSPLKEVTHEILVRTRPNIYDLIIAFFAGIAGAAALCTRKNYLFTTTGVAVATAVIPPLSVVGYGIGTFQWSIALGGFLLFFTNFVAIVLSSDIVFYLLRFRPSMVETDHSIRKRLQIMGVVLTLLCIPLVYTLVVDIRKVRISHRIETQLKKSLNRENHSRVTGFTESSDHGKMKIMASINTVEYYGSETEKILEKELGQDLGRPVSLELEQVIARSGTINPKPEAASTILPRQEPAPQPESLALLQEKTMRLIRQGCGEIQPFLAPYLIRECGVRFSDLNNGVSVLLTVARDYPFSEQEKHWLRLTMEKKLEMPLLLDLKTVPFLPSVTFDSQNLLTAESKLSLASLKGMQKEHRHFVILKPAGLARKVVTKREAALRGYLTGDLQLPPSAIMSGRAKGKDFSLRVRED